VSPAPQAQTPIGAARATGQDEHGVQHWSLTVYDIIVPGLWVVVDRELRPMR
jgi:hypothetical protein